MKYCKLECFERFYICSHQFMTLLLQIRSVNMIKDSFVTVKSFPNVCKYFHAYAISVVSSNPTHGEVYSIQHV